jgi:hypothetical protein
MEVPFPFSFPGQSSQMRRAFSNQIGFSYLTHVHTQTLVLRVK